MINLRNLSDIAIIQRHKAFFTRKITKNLSTKVAVLDEKVDRELARTIERITNIKTREYKKKPQKPPFAKNLFLGVFDTDILTYPEVLNKKGVDQLESDLSPIRDFFDNVDDKNQKGITREYLSNLSKLRLIGLQVSDVEGGRQLTLTEACRYLEEISKNPGRIGMIDNEQLGVQFLSKFGNDTHKKYLQQAMNGEGLIAFCASEATMANETSEFFNTKAVLSADKKTWTLNGTKSLIINGSIANTFIVFAETDEKDEKGLKNKSAQMFIVERDFPGVSSTPCDVIGFEQTDVSNITFQNTIIPAENVIGTVDQTNKTIVNIINEYRLSKGAVLTSLLKHSLNNFIRECIKIDGGFKNVLETETVQMRIGEITTALYTIESVTYLTAALIDQYENQDCELENSIVKFISAELCRSSLMSIMDFMGSISYLKDHWSNTLYRDALGHVLLSEPVDSLKITIALLGLRHAGINLQEIIKSIRNPFYNTVYVLKRLWADRKQTDDNPKLKLRLFEYLHPSLTSAAEFLEYCVHRLHFATETMLARHGNEVVNRHAELAMLAECIIDIYVMTAVLGRASRSYCIGLQHSSIEMEIAMAITIKARDRVRRNVLRIWHGSFTTENEKYFKIGKAAIEQKKYHVAHPLERMF